MNTPSSNTTSIDKVLKNAFGYWKKTFLYQALYGFLYLSILFSVSLHFADYFGILDQYMNAIEASKQSGNIVQELNKIAENENFLKFQGIQLATFSLLFPLQVGFFKMFRKIDLNEKFGMQDFLSGYTGINFFIYSSFYLFWYIIFGYAMSTVILGFVWIFITVFCVPLMFFENRRIFDSIGINLKILKQHFILIFVGLLVSFLFKIFIGITIIGIPFIMAYGNAMVYAIYRAVYTEQLN